MKLIVQDAGENYKVAVDACNIANKLQAEQGFLPIVTIYANVKGEGGMSVVVPQALQKVLLESPTARAEVMHALLYFFNQGEAEGAKIDLKDEEVARKQVQEAKDRSEQAPIPLGPGSRADN